MKKEKSTHEEMIKEGDKKNQYETPSPATEDLNVRINTQALKIIVTNEVVHLEHKNKYDTPGTQILVSNTILQ